MNFSRIELRELIKAWIAVSLMFAIAYVGFNADLPLAIGVSLLVAGISFIAHELAHKFVAHRYRCWAEFRANDQALVIGLVMSIFGIILAAPGGVHIRGATAHQHGKIALAGPMTNVLLAIICLIAMAVFGQQILLYALRLNAFLALFNLLPFQPFDGRSVLDWNKPAYAFAIVASGALMVASFLV